MARLWRPLHHQACGGFDQNIASAWHIEHVTATLDAVAERFAQLGDMEAKAGLLHEDVWPNLVDQLPAADDLSGPIDQCGKDVERPAAEPDDIIPSLEQALSWKELKRSERDRASHRQSRLPHPSVRPMLSRHPAACRPVPGLPR